MKKIGPIFLFAVIFALITAEISASDKGDADRVGGVRVGYHSAQFNLNGDFVGEPLQTFYVGLFRDTKVLPLLHFGSGLEYYKNGVIFDSKNLRELHYLSAPLDLKLKLGPVFALIGAAPSFRLADRISTDGVKEKTPDDQKSNWFDIPLFVGAGVKISFVTLEARYHWGMMEVVDGYKSQSFQLGAGISF